MSLKSYKTELFLDDENFDLGNNLVETRLERLPFETVIFPNFIFHISLVIAASSYDKNRTRTDEVTHAISNSTGTNRLRLPHHISFASTVTYRFPGNFRISAW